MGLTDTIARFLTEMLDESPGELLVQRQELAQRFGVVPSQINYVLSSRFSKVTNCSPFHTSSIWSAGFNRDGIPNVRRICTLTTLLVRRLP